MMNATRKEPFAIDVSFDCNIGDLESFALSFIQKGKLLLTKTMYDAVVCEERRIASLLLSGDETALFSSGEPVWVQVRAVLPGGEVRHSEVYEINVVDVLNVQEVCLCP